MKAKLGAVITEARGKLGGHHVSMHGGHCLVYSTSHKVLPKTKASFKTDATRNKLVSGWKALSDARRSVWNDAFDKGERRGCHVHSKIVSGFSLYCSRYFYHVFFKDYVTTLPTPYEYFARTVITSAENSVSINKLQIWYGPHRSGNDFALVYCCHTFSNAENFERLSFKLVFNVTNIYHVASNVYSAFVEAFGFAPIKGAYVIFKMVRLHRYNGVCQPPSYFKSKVLA